MTDNCNLRLTYGGQGGIQSYMANQSHPIGEPPLTSNANLRRPGDVGEPLRAVMSGGVL